MTLTDESSVAADLRQILEALTTLPAEKVAEVRDFTLYLQARFGAARDAEYADAWSDEDIRDATRLSLLYADAAMWPEDSDERETG